MSKILGRGAEAIVTQKKSTVIKNRPQKKYRHPILDLQLRKQRTRAEGKILQTLLQNNLLVPSIKRIDDINMNLEMSFVDGKKLRDVLSQKNMLSLCKQLGTIIAKMHNLDIIHSDLTTSNMIVDKNKNIFLIDFGLSYFSNRTEDRAVDLHLLKQALESYHFQIAQPAMKHILTSYKKEINDKDVLTRLETVERRGKNKQH